MFGCELLRCIYAITQGHAIIFEGTQYPSLSIVPNVQMAFDPLSPIAPARVRAIVLPVGRLKRSRFAEFLQLLREQRAVRLGDVTPDARPDRCKSRLRTELSAAKGD